MRILIAVLAYPPSSTYGGPASVAQAHARALSASGHEVTVLTTTLGMPEGVGDEESHVVIRLQPVGAPGSARFPTLVAEGLRDWLATHLRSFDVVHVHFAREAFAVTVASAARRAGVPLVLQPHGMLNGERGVRRTVDRTVVNRTLRRADAVLALQSFEHGLLSSRVPDAPLRILPNGIEPLSPHPPTHAALRSPATVLFLARVHPRKRPLEFVRMASHLVAAGVPARFRLVGPDGGLAAAVRAEVAGLGLDDVFTHAGSATPAQVAEELAQADVFVLPSFNDQFSMSVLESLWSGIPTVLTASNQLAGMLQARGAIRVADEDDVAASLAEQVRWLIEHPQEAGDMGRTGQQVVLADYTMASVMGQLERVYEEVSHGAARA